MIENHYPKIKRIIDEYQKDRSIFAAEKEIFVYYPKLFLMSIVSLFEKNIKERCNALITNVSFNVRLFPKLHRIIIERPNDYIDKIYAKFRARTKNGIYIYDANPFYELFGGQSFKSEVEKNYNNEMIKQIADYSQVIDSLSPLIGKGEQFDTSYLEDDEIFSILKANDFRNAESAFLKLKYQRNIVAHDFLTGISDSFEDIKCTYYNAAVYVIAVEKTIELFI